MHSLNGYAKTFKFDGGFGRHIGYNALISFRFD